MRLRWFSPIYMFSDFGRLRTGFSGTIALSCADVSGIASGSRFAAVTISRLSLAVGMSKARLRDDFNIMLAPPTFGEAKLNDSL